MKNEIILGLLLFGLGITFSACNTTQGIGEDVQATGRVIERAATPSTHHYH